MLLPGVCLGCENALQESFWGHPFDREQGPAPLAVITGPVGGRENVMFFKCCPVSLLGAAAFPPPQFLLTGRYLLPSQSLRS